MKHQSRHEILRSLWSPGTDAFFDKKATVGNVLISNVKDMVGGCVFLDLCCNETVLVQLSDIELYRDQEGFVRAEKLTGKVKWGSDKWKAVEDDKTATAKKRGLSKVKVLDNLVGGFPDKDWQYYLERIRLRKVKANGYNLLSLAEVKGTDLITGSERSLSKIITPGMLIANCLTVPAFQCEGRCPRGCISGSVPIIGCTCPGVPWWRETCGWYWKGFRCVNVLCLGGRCWQLWAYGGCVCLPWPF